MPVDEQKKNGMSKDMISGQILDGKNIKQAVNLLQQGDVNKNSFISLTFNWNVDNPHRWMLNTGNSNNYFPSLGVGVTTFVSLAIHASYNGGDFQIFAPNDSGAYEFCFVPALTFNNWGDVKGGYTSSDGSPVTMTFFSDFSELEFSEYQGGSKIAEWSEGASGSVDYYHALIYRRIA